MTDPNPSRENVARLLLRRAGLATLIFVLAGVGVGVWWQTRDRGVPTGAVPEAAISGDTDTAANADQGDQLLGRARTALNERRLLAPAGDNAVEYYLRAREVEASYAAARLALLDLIAPAVSAVESSIAAGDLVEAQRQFELLRRMGASELSLGPLSAQLEGAQLRIERAEELAAQAVAATPDAEPPPAVAAAAETAAPVPATAAATPGTTTPVVTPAPSVPPAPATPATVTSTPKAPIAEPAAEPASTAGASMAANASAVAATPRIEEPRQLIDVRPAYPSAAVQRRIEGWVELEVAIGSDGEVQEVKVVRSEPARVFDREAIRAAQRWRFEPRRENGVAVATRVRKTLSFKLGTR